MLNSQPDPAGLETYVDKVLRHHWSKDDIAKDLRHSDEYRKKNR